MNKYVRDLRTFPCAAAAAWRHQGIRGALTELRQRTLDRIIRHGRALVIEQELTSLPEVRTPAGVRVERFAGPDWSPLERIASRGTIDRFRRSVARGRSCLVAWRGERAIGYSWISDRVEPDIETYPLPLPAGTAYLWDLYVEPAERSSGVGSALVGVRLRYAREWGFRAAWRAIDVCNRASLRTLDKTTNETRLVGKLTYLSLLAVKRARFRPTPR